MGKNPQAVSPLHPKICTIRRSLEWRTLTIAKDEKPMQELLALAFFGLAALIHLVQVSR